MGSQNTTPQGNQSAGNQPPLSAEAQAAADAAAKAEAEAKAKAEADAKKKAKDQAQGATDAPGAPPQRQAVKALSKTKESATVTDGVEVWKHDLADGPIEKAIAPSLRKQQGRGEDDASADAGQSAKPERHAIKVLGKGEKSATVTDGVEVWKHDLADGPVEKAIAPSLRK